MTVRPLDTLLAVKTISLAPGLLENDRRVATVLIEHFNRKTGRCRPHYSTCHAGVARERTLPTLSGVQPG
jgi:hypothetical protein